MKIQKNSTFILLVSLIFHNIGATGKIVKSTA